MRKRSCKWPVWLTVLAFSSPVFYVLFRFNKPQIFSLDLLGAKVAGAAGCSVIVWFFYGIFCLVAPAKRSPEGQTPDAQRQSPTDS
jgi:hypothetical protein